MLGGILLHALQLILLAHSLVLVNTKGVVWQNLYALQHLVRAKVLAQSANINLSVAITGHQYIAQPKRLSVAFKPLRSTQSLLVAALGQEKVLCRVMLLHIEQYQIDNREQLLYPLVPYRAIRIDADMYALLFQLSAEGYQCLCLHGRLATAECDAATLAEEWFLTHRLLDDMLWVGRLCFALQIYGVGVGAI